MAYHKCNKISMSSFIRDSEKLKAVICHCDWCKGIHRDSAITELDPKLISQEMPMVQTHYTLTPSEMGELQMLMDKLQTKLREPTADKIIKRIAHILGLEVNDE